MVEAIMALVVAAMVFEALMIILPQSKKGTVKDLQTDFQAALTQLGRQGYQLDQVQAHEIQLKKAIGDPVTLKVAKHDLVLDGTHHGRVLLLHGIDDLLVDNLGTYQFLTVSSHGHEKASGTLFLPKTKQVVVEEG
ncbi:hypothetical protein [Fructobacillus evanidus]|uniref:Competence protein ComGF n=1 Tax=Fructobacillus evanidus TaxID=3064281 RepID=A0ABM9MQ25_9LACO|nr:hypothetical protein R53718_MFFEMHAI_00432 [Fructobacillus sp. LMG 32999]CAK1231659.1 hypothetical protein R55214_HHFBAMCI_00386 [Fructobacillus sp. LMG 32999]CAK1232933.1 hypothetical protein R55203_MFJFHIJN_00441 [Fructobacillus sp. LMG 32999]CAK1235662.1 hypothetical protein R54837_OMAIDLJD_00571 [Fructobacillus sp. LMG 32999]CAK1238836.1 hypothetical protein R55250_KEHBDPNM_01131 [Fructobacillus sp. LMG 32999]